MDRMNPRERIFFASKGKCVDRPPCICPGGMMNMMFKDIMDDSGFHWPMVHNDSDMMAGLARALYKKGGFENYGVPFCMTVEAEALGADVDMGDEFYEPHVVNSPLKSVEEFRSLPDISLEKGRIPVVLDAIKKLKKDNDEVPVVGNICGPISLAGTLVDMEILLKAMRKNPELVHEFLSYTTNQLVAFGKAMISAGVDVICVAEPSGTGELLGPKRFKEYTVTYVNRLLDELSVDVKIVHICGKLSAVFDVIDEFHSDVFSCDSIVNIKELKEHLSSKVCMGNVSTMALASMEEEKIKELVGVSIENGTSIVAPACGISTSTPLKNVLAMVNATKALKGQEK